ncbi:CPBP family intramembrane glutamic endopeptidase [Cytobacillus sp. FJAT-54145]|uniref:CPBP family intramembrane glutamic endopeptidase n=1 Tax=Cytobacillus spartinae TaxID=3299023 RepID=A0ABW6K8N1_9BACI
MSSNELTGTGVLLAFLFIVIQFLFQVKLFSYGFIILLLLIIPIPFFKEEKRLFIWTMFAFFVGELFYFYGDRLLLELPYSKATILILSRFLLLIPIILISYVVYKFHQRVFSFWAKPNWGALIEVPFRATLRTIFIIGLIVVLFTLAPFMINHLIEIQLTVLVRIFIFAIISASLEEVLWRGTLLTRVSKLVGNVPGLVFTSIAYGLSYIKFGISPVACGGIVLIGLIFGAITVKSGSLLPAILWHFVLLTLLLLSGMIPLLTI